MVVQLLFQNFEDYNLIMDNGNISIYLVTIPYICCLYMIQLVKESNSNMYHFAWVDQREN